MSEFSPDTTNIMKVIVTIYYYNINNVDVALNKHTHTSAVLMHGYDRQLPGYHDHRCHANLCMYVVYSMFFNV
jgi:hypothetical protein